MKIIKKKEMFFCDYPINELGLFLEIGVIKKNIKKWLILWHLCLYLPNITTISNLSLRRLLADILYKGDLLSILCTMVVGQMKKILSSSPSPPTWNKTEAVLKANTIKPYAEYNYNFIPGKLKNISFSKLAQLVG